MDELIPTFLDRVSMYWQTPAGNGREIPPEILERFAFNAPRDFLPGESARGGLDEAIRKTQGYFLRTQKPDGHWVGELEADTTLTADYILLMHFLGEVDEREQQRAARYLLKKQLADGGWNIYANGPSEISPP